MSKKRSGMKYKLVASGGTFDHFHKGHREFLEKQFEVSEKVLLGIASDSFVKDRKQDLQIQDYQTRKNAVEEFLKQENFHKRAQIVSIDNIYIPEEWNNLPIEAIVVTEETKTGADLINKKRSEESLPPLEVMVVKHVLAEDGIPISSHRIRKGEINRNGRRYIKSQWFLRDLILPEDIRSFLKKPFGKIIVDNPFEKETSDPFRVITVGDVTTQLANKAGFCNKISVIDFLIERKRRFNTIKDLGFKGTENLISVVNPRGTIASDMFLKIKEAFSLKAKERIVLLIEGEEDLAVLPCILLSPIGAVIFYGQPQQGTVRLEVSEDIKEQAYLIVSKFIQK